MNLEPSDPAELAFYANVDCIRYDSEPADVSVPVTAVVIVHNPRTLGVLVGWREPVEVEVDGDRYPAEALFGRRWSLSHN